MYLSSSYVSCLSHNWLYGTFSPAESNRERRYSTTLAPGSPFRFEEDRGREWELPLFEPNTIVTATNNFAFRNKLGEGGFGPVYKVMKTENASSNFLNF